MQINKNFQFLKIREFVTSHSWLIESPSFYFHEEFGILKQKCALIIQLEYQTDKYKINEMNLKRDVLPIKHTLQKFIVEPLKQYFISAKNSR